VLSGGHFFRDDIANKIGRRGLVLFGCGHCGCATVADRSARTKIKERRFPDRRQEGAVWKAPLLEAIFTKQ
jgi:hypothetical protein